MNTLKIKTRKINGQEVETWCRDFNEGNEKLSMEVGRTEFGGDSGREDGARMYLSLKCRAGDFFFRPIINRMGQFCGFEMACCGNKAVLAAMDSLLFATDSLLDRCRVGEMWEESEKGWSTHENEDPDDSCVLHCEDLDDFPEDAHCCPKCPKWDTCDRRKE